MLVQGQMESQACVLKEPTEKWSKPDPNREPASLPNT